MAASTVAVHANDAAIRRAIQGRYAELSLAFTKKDAKAFEAGFAPDYVAKGTNGKIKSRAAVIKDFEAQMKALSDVKWTQSIRSLKVDGKVVHVVVDSKMIGKVVGGKGPAHAVRLEGQNKSDWVKSNVGWQVKRSESTGFHVWMDGNPIKF